MHVRSRHVRPRRVLRTPVALAAGAVLATLLLAAGVIELVSGSSPVTTPKNPLVGKVIPGFTLPSVTGTGVLASPWTDGHAAVVLFFAHWCVPCRTEVPTLALAVGRGEVGNVQIVGVDEDLSIGTARGFVSASNVQFPVGEDHLTELAEGLVPAGLPAAVFVAADGKVVDVRYGALSVMQLSAGLSELKAPSGAARTGTS